MPIRVIPQSLFGRLMVALLGVVGITLLIVVVLIVRERREFALLWSGGWGTAQIIAETSASLWALKGADREQALQRYLAEPVSVDTPDFPPLPQRRQDMEAAARTYAGRIQQELGTSYRVRVSPARPRSDPVIHIGSEPRRLEPPPDSGRPDATGLGGEGASARFAGPMPARFLDVSVFLPDGQELVFRTAAPQPGPPLPPQIFIQLGVLTCILAVVLFFMTRSITRPLSDLAHAAESVGRGARHAPLAERGAREVRNATRAFNTMQERLQRYLDSRTRVLAAMSHDLRTPLTRLRLRAESIADPALRDRFAADLDEMNGMVKGALGLFRDLNDEEPLESVDIDVLLEKLQVEFAETGGEIVIEGRTAGPLPARPKALKRCLANLLHNAIKYGGRAKVLVSDGTEVVLRIQDEGTGIPEEYLEQVFEPFFRVEGSRNRDTGGTGLGLCIARDVAQGHGGAIKLANLPSGGLEATLFLPRTTSG